MRGRPRGQHNAANHKAGRPRKLPKTDLRQRLLTFGGRDVEPTAIERLDKRNLLVLGSKMIWLTTCN
jgi:hypothetical protein